MIEKDFKALPETITHNGGNGEKQTTDEQYQIVEQVYRTFCVIRVGTSTRRSEFTARAMMLVVLDQRLAEGWVLHTLTDDRAILLRGDPRA